jgi:signal peptidase I
MNLDQPWKIGAVIGLVAFLRIIWALWRRAPARPFMVELLDSGLIAFVLVFLLIRPFVVQAFYIPSRSMVPALLDGDRILVNRFLYRLNPPERGDIIVFNAPPQALQGDSKKDYVKRLIGLPGDAIEIKRGLGVFINGTLLRDAPGVPLPEYDWPVDEYELPTGRPYVVPQGCYFVLGDNRNDSNDSHKWTEIAGNRRVPRPELEGTQLVGKAMAAFWPLSRIGLVSDHQQVSLPTPSRRAARPGAAAAASR